MLKYGGVPLSVATPELALAIEKGLPPSDLFPFERADWPGVSRLLWGQPDMPRRAKPRVGVLTWPRDAQRWAHAYMLATTNQLNAIRAQLTTYQALPLEMSQENAQGQTVQSITAPMWMLPPRPIFQLAGRNGLYLLTLVDDRYWWWQRDTGELPVTAGVTTWANLYTGVAAALGVTINADTINAAYLFPSVALTARYEHSAMLLDAVARNVGQRIVRDLDGTVHAYNVSTSQTLLATNSAFLTTGVIAGGSFSFSPGTTPNDLPSLLPGSVRLTFPQVFSGSPTGDVYPVTVSLASLNLSDVGTVGNSSIKTFHDTCNAAGTSIPLNSGELTALTQQLATDWYRSLLASWDGKLAGIVPWTMEGLSDCIEWTYRKGEVSTRIHRPPWNDLDEQMLHNSPSAGSSADPVSLDMVTSVCPIFASTSGSGTRYLTGITVQYQSLTLPGGTRIGAAQCLTNPSNCCPGSGSGSGSGDVYDVSTPCCPGVLLPSKIIATFSTADCPNLNGQQYTLTWTGAHYDSGQRIINNPSDNPSYYFPFEIVLSCGGSSWSLAIDCGTVDTAIAPWAGSSTPSVSSCSPFEVEFSGLSIPDYGGASNCDMCGLGVTGTFNITFLPA